MPITKIIKYPGTKNTLIPLIKKVFVETGASVLIDVFGGSGAVCLNVDASQTVYNDLNKEIFNLFKVIKSRPNNFLQVARKWTSSRDQFNGYYKMVSSGKMNVQDEVQSAFRTFYKFNVGFGGMGSTYRTKKEKSAYSTVLKILSNYSDISSRISKWTIENLDFRELMRKYHAENVFFYLDPPYTSKSWYDVDFNIRALEDLKKLTGVIRGKYLCTFDFKDENSKEVFGEPNHVVRFVNQNKQKKYPQVFRDYSLYYNAVVKFE